MQFLRLSTTGQVIKIGPLADIADGTAQTGLTIANTDIKLLKNNATSSTNKNSGGATELETGDYYATLDDTDTNTLGRLSIKVAAASTLVWSKDFMVLPANVYDGLVLGTDWLKVNAYAPTFSVSGSTLTVKKVDGTTTTTTKTITATQGADPITAAVD